MKALSSYAIHKMGTRDDRDFLCLYEILEDIENKTKQLQTNSDIMNS